MTVYEQASAIPFRYEDNQIKILIISSRSGKRWIIPKGIIENGDGAALTAEKETLEEAGVQGYVNEGIIGEYKYSKWGGSCRVQVFSLLVNKELDDWDEKAFRKREWVDAKTAVKKLEPAALKKIIKKFLKSQNNHME